MSETKLMILYLGSLIVVTGGMVVFAKSVLDKNQDDKLFHQLVLLITFGVIIVLLGWFIYSDALKLNTLTLLMITTAMFNGTLLSLKALVISQLQKNSD